MNYLLKKEEEEERNIIYFLMSSSPDNHSSNINIKQSEQRLNHELKNITPVIGNIIKSLFNSFNGILPACSI